MTVAHVTVRRATVGLAAYKPYAPNTPAVVAGNGDLVRAQQQLWRQATLGAYAGFKVQGRLKASGCETIPLAVEVKTAERRGDRV